MRDVSLAGHHVISSFGVPVYVWNIPGLCIPYSLPKSVMVMRAVSLERGLTALGFSAGGDAGCQGIPLHDQLFTSIWLRLQQAAVLWLPLLACCLAPDLVPLSNVLFVRSVSICCFITPNSELVLRIPRNCSISATPSEFWMQNSDSEFQPLLTTSQFSHSLDCLRDHTRER